MYFDGRKAHSIMKIVHITTATCIPFRIEAFNIKFRKKPVPSRSIYFPVSSSFLVVYVMITL